MAVGDRVEYLLPCGHRSAGVACFQCAIDEFIAAARAAETPADEEKPVALGAVPRFMTITVVDPPHVLRFDARRPRR